MCLDALRVPLVGDLASVRRLALSGTGPSLATALTEASLHRTRGLSDGGRWVNDGGLSDDRRVGDDGSSNTSGGKSIAVPDHGSGVGTGLDRVATRELVEVDSFNTLVDDGIHGAAVHFSIAVPGEGTARLGLATDVCALVHCTLKGIILPTEDVVSVLSIPSGVTHGEDEWLSTAAGPLVVELTGVPDNFEEEQWHTGGVRRRAASDVEEETITANGASGVSHMGSMIRGIEVTTVPAGWEEDVGANTSCTLTTGESNGITITGTGVWIRGVAPEVSAEASE